jgi:hypothetical protein
MAHRDGQDGGMAILDGVWRHPAILAHRQAWHCHSLPLNKTINDYLNIIFVAILSNL